MSTSPHEELNTELNGWYTDKDTGETKLYVADNLIQGACCEQTFFATKTIHQDEALTTNGIGADGSDATSTTEHGTGNKVHVTEVAFSKPFSVAAGALSAGAELYTLPAVPCLLLGLSVDAYVQSTGAGGAVGDVGEVGMGTAVGSGANALLSAVGSSAEDIVSGTAHGAVAADTSGAGNLGSAAGGTRMLPAGTALHYNIAGMWSGVDELTLAGTARVAWIELG